MTAWCSPRLCLCIPKSVWRSGGITNATAVPRIATITIHIMYSFHPSFLNSIPRLLTDQLWHILYYCHGYERHYRQQKRYRYTKDLPVSRRLASICKSVPGQDIRYDDYDYDVHLVEYLVLLPLNTLMMPCSIMYLANTPASTV